VATFVSDSFTDTSGTALASHTGETGATWAKNSAYAGDLVISNANRCRHVDDTSNAGYYASGTPANADYEVQAIIRFLTDTGAGIGAAGRMSTSANTMYFVDYETNASDTLHRLFSMVTGTAANLGTYSDVLSAGNERVQRLRMEGDNIDLYVDDVLRVNPAANTAVTAAGKAGIRAFLNGSDTTGVHIDTYSATDIEAGGSTVPAKMQSYRRRRAA
jgi:hypothetical protein